MADELLQVIPRLWRGSHLPGTIYATIPTGYSALDQVLPGGGWPLGAVIEILAGNTGIGEMRMLIPVIRHMTQINRYVFFVNPPHTPNATALYEAAVDLERLLVLTPDRQEDALWSAEQSLHNQACGVVLLWPKKKLLQQQVRRLQVAAQDGRSMLFLYRHGEKHTSSWAALRLALNTGEYGLHVSVLKATGTHKRPRVYLALE